MCEVIKNPTLCSFEYNGKGEINKREKLDIFFVPNQSKDGFLMKTIFFFMCRLSRACFFVGNITLLNNDDDVSKS